MAQRGEVVCSKSPGWSEAEQGLELSLPSSKIDVFSWYFWTSKSPDRNTIPLRWFGEGKTYRGMGRVMRTNKGCGGTLRKARAGSSTTPELEELREESSVTGVQRALGVGEWREAAPAHNAAQSKKGKETPTPLPTL